MTKLTHVNRTTGSIACCSVLLLAAVALALDLGTAGQHSQDPGGKDKAGLIKQVEDSPDQFLKIVAVDASPLRLVEAKVKEVPGHLFTRLTGRVTDMATVSSFPEVKLVNTSAQTVTGFMVGIRDPKTRTTRALFKSKVSIKPGEAYMMSRELFSLEEKMTADGTAKARRAQVKPGMDSEKSWIQFAPPSDLFVLIGLVDFEDGGRWVLKEGMVKEEGGEIK